MANTGKNVSVEAFRFFFMLLICMWHSPFHEFLGLHHGYVAVEFFFILSGVLLFYSYDRPDAKGTLEYSIAKFKRFFPEYLVGVLIGWIVLFYKWLPQEWTIDSIASLLLRFSTNSLMLNDIGMFLGGVNYPLWYISVLIFGGGIVYSCLKFSKRLSLYILFPLVILLTYTFLFSYGEKNSIEVWTTCCGFYMPFWRGVAGLSLGILLGYVMRYKSKICYKNIHIVNIIGILSFFTMLYLAYTTINQDQYSLLASTGIIVACFAPNSRFSKLFKHSIWTLLGGITYEMLLLHAPIAFVVGYAAQFFNIGSLLGIFVYLSLLVLSSYILKISYNSFCVNRSSNKTVEI